MGRLPMHEVHTRIREATEQVRNVSVLAHVDHGKGTLQNLLVQTVGVTATRDARLCERLTDTRPDSYQECCVTGELPSVPLYFELSKQSVSDESLLKQTGALHRDFLLNLMDTTGYLDSRDVPMMHAVDGALLVADCVEGVSMCNGNMMRQVLKERIKPVLLVNKVDRMFLELQLDPEEAYQSFSRTIQTVNVMLATFDTQDDVGDLQVCPVKGTIVFGSALHGWAFSLNSFARLYAEKFGVEEEKMVKRLWGDCFFDSRRKRWTSGEVEGTQRAFSQFILEPIRNLFDAVMNSKTDKLEKMLKALNITLDDSETDLTQKPLLKCIMQKFLPASDVLLQMIVTKLPSPKQAQAYRADLLYTGMAEQEGILVPNNDKYYQGLKSCDPEGPLLMFVAKMVPTRTGGFIAFGRVFSGTIKAGQKVRIMGANHEHGTRKDVAVKSVGKLLTLLRPEESVDDISCGNVVGLSGVDSAIVKTATLTDEAALDCHPLRCMKFNVSPVVRVTVSCVSPAHLPTLIESLKRLSKCDSRVQCSVEESGHHTVACCGEIHLETCLRELHDTGILVSEPTVLLRETITEASDRLCLSKSPNKHSRVLCRGAPLGEELCEAIEDTSDVPHLHAADCDIRARRLVDLFGWDLDEARKIWCFGPDSSGPNVLVDLTKGVDCMDDVRDCFATAWGRVTSEGVLCEEKMRGVRINIEDAVIQQANDDLHRRGPQVMTAARRSYYASCLASKPALMEPVYLVDISTPNGGLGGVYGVLHARRGILLEENRSDRFTYHVRAYVPVLESFGLTAALLCSTGGQAWPQCVFDHWAVIPSDPLAESGLAAELVKKMRVDKGLSPEVPRLEQFTDKL